jgi:integrase/recombinase XerD
VTECSGRRLARVGLGGVRDRLAQAEQLIEHPTDPALLQARIILPLGVRDTQIADGFEVELDGLGYVPGSIAQQLRLMARLDAWLAERDLGVGDLSDVVVERFMAPRRAAGEHLRTARALDPLLDYLRRVHAAPPPAAAAASGSPVDDLLERYGRYLRVERGLAASTVSGYLVIARQFLEDRNIGAAADLAVLGPQDVSAFVAAACRTRRGRDVVTALRSLLTFLHVEGFVGGGLGGGGPVGRGVAAGRASAGAPTGPGAAAA